MRPAGTAQAAARGYGSGDNCPQEHNKNIDAKQICADAQAVPGSRLVRQKTSS